MREDEKTLISFLPSHSAASRDHKPHSTACLPASYAVVSAAAAPRRFSSVLFLMFVLRKGVSSVPSLSRESAPNTEVAGT